MDIRSSKGVRITGPRVKFTGHSHIQQIPTGLVGPVMNKLLLDQTNFIGHCHMSDGRWELHS